MRPTARPKRVKVPSKRAGTGRAGKPTQAKIQAKRLVAKKAPGRKDSRDRESEKRLAEGLEREKAIGEILRVMSVSPGDVQPVLEAVAERAAHLCGAPYANVLIRDGEMLRPSAFSRLPERTSVLPIPLTRGSVNGRAVLDRTTIHHADIVPFLDTEFPDARQNVQRLGVRAHLAVPLLRNGEACGTIVVFRREPRPFSPEQIALVETFAQQAVIAIDNARLFNETKEALEQQTATSEILRIISSSRGDVQPMLSAVAERAMTLCEAANASIFLVEGDNYRMGARFGDSKRKRQRALELGQDISLTRGSAAGRAILDRTTVHLEDLAVAPEDEYPVARRWQRIVGHHTILAVPLMREDRAIGAISLFRMETRPFTEKQISLVKTFADQAAIAIEDVRLFNETTEALEQQKASGEVLATISSSIADTAPVFDKILQSCERLFAGTLVTIHILGEDGLTRIVAHRGPNREAFMASPPAPVTDQRATGICIKHRTVLHYPDTEDEAVPPGTREGGRLVGTRAAIFAPMLWEGRAIGVIAVCRVAPGPFSDKEIALLKTFADQAVIAVENARLFNETKQALERQTATSEILRVISQSPRDVQPVFDTIVKNAVTLCEARFGAVFRLDGGVVHLAAQHNLSEELIAQWFHTFYPMAPNRGHVSGRTILAGAAVQVPDILDDKEYLGAGMKSAGFRSLLGMPLLRDGTAIGAIVIYRVEPGQFEDRHIELLKTFADQAVIAIENVRLFTELTHKNNALTQAHAQVSETLERQTATSEILRVISETPTDVQPVFETIATAAMKLCGGNRAHVFTSDGEQLYVGALASTEAGPDEEIRRQFPRRLGNDLAASRAILTGGVVVIPDVLIDPEYALKELAPAGAFRSVLGVPLLREGSPIGAIAVSRPEPGAFPDNQITLLQTFAAQAVIAIENVRLFNETKEALEQQTATADILRVISQSPRDVQPVFEIIAQSALRLCNASSSNVVTYDGQLVRVAAQGITDPAGAAAIRKLFPRPPDRGIAATRAIVTSDVVAISDVMADVEFSDRANALAGGFRSVLAVPLLRGGKPIGAIAVGRPQPGSFPDKQVNLLRTFADQAVIAIENVRLFTELESRTLDLTRSVGELKALGEVGQAVSSTLDLETVLSTIVSRAAKLAGMDGGSIWEYNDAREEFHLHATDRFPNELVEVLRSAPIRKGEGAVGRLAVTGELVEIRDIAREQNYPNRLREALVRGGYRSALVVPLLREEHLLGALAVNRSSPGEFAEEVIRLLKTFATQSALAIQNARLYREIEVKSRELEAASRHKSEFLANMSHELRTPLNAIIGFSEVLSERMFGEINEKQAEYIGDILQSGQHLLSLINDILDLSKIEAGRMELELGEFDLPSTIDTTLLLVRERAQRRGISLTRAVDERLGMIRADERKVKQVLLNLLSNALKFTPEGGKIDVRAAASDSAAEISVADTGVGIAPEDQAAVFEEFRQVGTASKKVEGTGLGLAISRKFIELHGGRIWVTSQVGMGSTFTFTLPLQGTSPT